MASKDTAAAAKAATLSLLNWGKGPHRGGGMEKEPAAGGGEQPTSG
jgi:hypothetical protein